MNNLKYLILRRVFQSTLLLLYFGANAFGWKVLEGTISNSIVLDKIPLSDPFAVSQMLVAGAALSFDVILGAIIIVLFYAIIGGRSFCSWVCPVNIVTDTASWLRRKLYIDKIEKSIRIGRDVRYYLIGLALIVSFASGLAAFEIISPISILNRGVIFGFGAGAGLLIAIFLFDLFVLKNGWCGHICPLGGVYALIGKFSVIRVRHNSDNCTLCMKCKEVCPEMQVLDMVGKRSEFVSGMECTNCGRCVDVCNDDALHFDIRKFNHLNLNNSQILSKAQN